jgi:hypothetical protein
VSNVIDLLINLAFFVYFGTIIPWEQYNSAVLGITPWRLVVIGLLVLFFRRIPIMLMLKPIIPDLKTWREAMFAGHFGPIGVGAIFVAIMARAELETETTTPLAEIPPAGFEHLNIIELIWPITTFLVIVSIVVHGSSIAVFTLGRHINTLAISVSFTKPNEELNWMDRLPRIQSRSKSSMSLGRRDDTESSLDEKMEEGVLSPSTIPKGFLRRLRDEDTQSRSSSVKAQKKRKKWDAGIGPGGPVSSTAIKPAPRSNTDHSDVPDRDRSGSDTLVLDSSPDSDKRDKVEEPEEEVYREGDKDIIEDEEGNVLEVRKSKPGESETERDRHVLEDERNLMRKKHVEHGVAQTEHELDEKVSGDKIAEEIKEAVASRPQLAAGSTWRDRTKKMTGMTMLSELRKKEEAAKPEKKHGPALAYQFGNTIIVEDEDGEVIKKYDIPAQEKNVRPSQDRKASFLDPSTRANLERMGTWMGVGHKKKSVAATPAEAGPSTGEEGYFDRKPSNENDEDEETIRFTLGAGGRRMSKADFIQTVQRLDPKTRQRLLDQSDAPEELKREASSAAHSMSDTSSTPRQPRAQVQRVPTAQDRPSGPEGLTLVDSNNEDIPFHPVSDTLARFNLGGNGGETAAQRRRRRAQEGIAEEEEEDPRGPPRGRARDVTETSASPSRRPGQRVQQSYLDEGETAAERRRRVAALEGGDDSSSEEEEGGLGFREVSSRDQPKKPEQTHQRGPSIRFAEPAPQQGGNGTGRNSGSYFPTRQGQGQGQGEGHSRNTSDGSSMRLRWSANVGKKPGEGSEAK